MIVRARVPLDVDLEDKLLYGLTPTRLVYLVIGLLAAFSLWSGRWAPGAIRAAAAAAVALAASGAAWGSWRGRPVDAWVTDMAAFIAATFRLRWRRPRLRLPWRRRRP